ncbi:unnamed protein product [Polarella glacialis]|uniref:Uncharacterized protein n=1 Tax=Polarella glacialis TaxID=89957 RepID=A0A813FTV8_POLGL|nr:unnamed protein product [Polarella glacialis]
MRRHLPTILLSSLLAATPGCSQSTATSASKVATDLSFEEYLLHFGKTYEGAEFTERKALYEKHVAEIIQHNLQPHKLWKKSVNKFTDGSRPSSSRHLPRQNPAASENVSGVAEDAVPETVDWRTSKPPILHEAIDQGACGDCWAIGPTKAVESQLALATGELLMLSTQSVSDCSSVADNPRHDCNLGGYAGDALRFAKSHGIALAEVYPRLGAGAACNLLVQPAVGVTGFGKPAANSAMAMMAALATVGPVSIGVASLSWDFYDSGIFDGCDKAGAALDHEVLLVGYGAALGTDGVSVKYWVVQNSWGANWGEAGFIRLRRYEQEPCGRGSCGECGLLADGTYPTGAFRHLARRLQPAEDVGSILV